MSEELSASLGAIFGGNMKRLREMKGWSQSELARQMNEHGWPKYSQVAVSRTEDGSRIVRLDEALAIANLLDTTVNHLVSRPDSHTSWIEDLRRQTDLIMSAAKNLNDAARSYEDTREMAQITLGMIRHRASKQKAAKSLKDSLEKEIDQLEELVKFSSYTLLDWVEEQEDKALRDWHNGVD